MAGVWRHFADTGSPNGPTWPTWPTYVSATDPYLRFVAAPTADTGLRTVYCDFWETALQ